MESLREYRNKRPLGKSPEPRGGRASEGRDIFVVQRHDATRLHYDFRLELDGVLKSWAVPKGPSLDPSVKRLAIQVEDHPLDYGKFEGRIPEGNYGAGEVLLWDTGTYAAQGPVPADEQLRRGELKFILNGHKLKGGFVLVRLKSSTAKKEWLLIKHRDAEVQAGWNIEDHSRSVKTGRSPGPPRHANRSKSSASLSSRVQDLSKAVKAALPEDARPGLASTGAKPFSSEDWLFEIKWDGIRALFFVEDGTTKLISRSGRDITKEYPEFHDLAKQVRAREAVLDGEIVVLDAEGRSNFQRLQSRFGIVNPSPELKKEVPVSLYLFDVLYCDGFDIRATPLVERKQFLSQLIAAGATIRISDHIVGQGKELFEQALKKGLEGIIGKRADSAYPLGRTSNWLKFKSTLELDAVVGGWTDPRGARGYFGSLLAGLYKGASLKFIGGVGTGFSNKLEEAIFQKLQQLSSTQCPFAQRPKTRELAHWVQPKLVARVGYAEWTSDDRLRQPRFLGLQPDRAPRECTFAKEKKTKPPVMKTVETRAPQQTRLQESLPADKKIPALLEILREKHKEEVRLELGEREVKLTHLNKVYFPKAGYTKRDVLSYYVAVSPFLLPFLQDRPLVLHRYPGGIAGGGFYQKEAGPSIPGWIRTVDIFSETKRENVPYFIVEDLAGLLYLTNLGCIEHNPFSARADDLEKPDYMFMDLDPTEGTAFPQVVRAALLIGKVLKEASLKFFLKTSGATGLHMFIPIARNYSFDQVRGFLEIVVRMAMEREKELLTRIFRVQNRPKNTVFVDVRQNAYAQSLASVFSLRPREGAPVSTPLSFNELKPGLRPERWNLESVQKDLPRRSRLWSTFWNEPQSLENALAEVLPRSDPSHE